MKTKHKKNINKLVFICLIIVTLTMTVAYSALTTSLTISGEVVFEIEHASGINITNLVCTSNSTPVGVVDYNNNNELDMSIGVTLSDLASTVTCSATIENPNDNMVKLNNIENTIFDNNNFTYKISGLYLNDIINANSQRDIAIIFKYKSTVATIPADTTLESTLTFDFLNIANNSIVKDGLIFYITGEDNINSAGMWPERINGTDVTLYGDVARIASTNSYYFPGTNSCGYTNTSLIPHEARLNSSDTYGYAKSFTVEVRLTPDNYDANMAIVAQKRLATIATANEVGRFKPFDLDVAGLRYFWQYETSLQSLNQYYSTLVTGGVPMYLTMTYNITNDTTRRGVATKYINGVPVGNNEVFTEAVISDFTTQIGCWNSYESSQNYKGYINMVRIYDRVLNPTEIYNNYTSDMETFTKTYTEKNLKTIALAQEATGDGSRLIVDNNYVEENGVSRYVYQGTNPNNYFVLSSDIIYDDSDNIVETEQKWRIMSFETDGTMKLMKPAIYQTAFDQTGERTEAANPYCVHSEDYAETLNGVTLTKGCNAFGNHTTYGVTISNASYSTLYTGTIANPAVSQVSTMNRVLNNLGTGTFYTPGEISAINASNASLWDVGVASLGTYTVDQNLDEINDYTWTGKVGSISVYDIRMSNLTTTTSTSAKMGQNYITALASNNNIDIWTINASRETGLNDTWDVINIMGGSNTQTINKRRASRATYGTVKFYTIPVIRISSDLDVTGTGTIGDPYRVITEE